jgi:hypothetical protein
MDRSMTRQPPRLTRSPVGNAAEANAAASREAMVAISTDMPVNPDVLVIQEGYVAAKGFATKGMKITTSISIATSISTWITMTTTMLAKQLLEASSASVSAWPSRIQTTPTTSAKTRTETENATINRRWLSVMKHTVRAAYNNAALFAKGFSASAVSSLQSDITTLGKFCQYRHQTRRATRKN